MILKFYKFWYGFYIYKHFFSRLKYFLQDEGCFPCGGYALCYGFTILEVHGYRTDKAYDQTDITELGSPQPTRMPQSAAILRWNSMSELLNRLTGN